MTEYVIFHATRLEMFLQRRDKYIASFSIPCNGRLGMQNSYYSGWRKLEVCSSFCNR